MKQKNINSPGKQKIVNPSGEKKWLNDENKARWHKALEWLIQTDLYAISPGKYNIEGNDVYALVTSGPTKEPQEAKWEAHRKYADVQYVISGKEMMGMAPLSEAIPSDPFDDEKDIGFFNIDESHCTYHTATPDQFFIFFPDDAHRPSIRVPDCSNDKKVVVKVRL